MITASFTDTYGNQLTDAIVKITQVSYVASHRIDSMGPDLSDVAENQTYRLDYAAEYWISQEAKDAGYASLRLQVPSNLMLQRTYPDAPDTSKLEELAETALLEDIIPNMQ